MKAPARPFTAPERLLAALSACGLGLALDQRELREALAEDRDEPNALFLRPAWLARLDELIVEGIAGRLEATTTPGQPARGLIVGAPPRHGKSHLTSIHTPAWFLGLHPHKRVILVANTASLAATFGQAARDLYEHAAPGLYGHSVRADARAASHWRTERGGGMLTAGIGGPITGQGADLMVIDDPFKNAEEAMSQVIRGKVWDWWLSTARTRLHPGAFVLLTMTRWHEDDIAGRLLREAREDPARDQWCELMLPALAESGDPLERQPGEALWPARYSAEDLERTRSTVGAYWWGAMFQQHPSPDDGGIFTRGAIRHFEIVDWREVPPRPGSESFASQGRVPSVVALDKPAGREIVGLDHQRIYQTVDVAVSEKQTADYTVCITFAATTSGDLLVLDVERRRIPAPDQPELLRWALDAWGAESVHIERMGYQAALLQQLARDGLPVLPLEADKDKVSRAALAAALYQGATIWHPRAAPWRDAFEAELLAFPVGEHDDQVDALAYGARVMRDLPGRVSSVPRPELAGTVFGGLDPRGL